MTAVVWVIILMNSCVEHFTYAPLSRWMHPLISLPSAMMGIALRSWLLMIVDSASMVAYLA